ncbi:MAG TPA: response regulator transcription factor [Solirubrobacteraceae bacterium]|nr:response regulator transcription factor [Solirubrobacteraceae bacterium]
MSPSPAAGDRLRLLVVDDHDVVHWGLRIMLERLPWIESSYSAHTGSEAVESALRNQIDLALVDLFVGPESGADICQRLRSARPEVRVLLISGVGQMSPKAAAACGASGFVSKDSRGRDMIRAVARVAGGGSVFDEESEETDTAARLSQREREVLTLVAAGSTNREIAAQLSLSPHTVKEYTSTLYRKLDVRNRLEAVNRAQQLGLIG